MSEHEYTAGRLEMTGENTGVWTQPLDYTDGYRVTVGWSDEDNAWIAECSGFATGNCLADGQTQTEALLALACCMAAHIDAVANPVHETPNNLTPKSGGVLESNG